MLWVDTTLASLMSGLATMVGPERFSLALQSEGRKSVESDWLLMSSYPDFNAGFAAIGVVAAVAGWGEWQLLKEDSTQREFHFRAYNTWEGLCQKKLGTCWGSAMLAGKFAGYCSFRLNTNCWATQTAFIAKGDPYDEFRVAPSSRNVEDEIERLLSTDQATRADMAVALTRLHEVQSKILLQQGTLEEQVRQRTAELALSLNQLQSVNEQLRLEVDEHSRAEAARKESEDRLRKIIEHAPISMAVVDLDGTIDYINRKAIETFGYLPEDIPNMDRWWVQAYPDATCRREAIERWTGYVTVAIAEGRDIQRDHYRISCKDGAVKTIACFGVPVAGKICVMFDDITLQAFKEDLMCQSNVELERRVAERTAELAERNQLLQVEISERKKAQEQMVQANLILEHSTAQLRKLGTTLARIEETERNRLAHILHDQLQQMLVAARFNLSALEKGLLDKHLLESARAAGEAVDEALRESKSLVLELSPPILREGGLIQALQWIGRRMFEKHGLTVQVEADECDGLIGEDLRIALFHAVRELLFNVVKHAGVTSARVELALLPDRRVRVTVSDRGCGYSPSGSPPRDEADPGFGQMAIQERFCSFGGQMTVESAPGEGCRVTLIAPIADSPLPDVKRVDPGVISILASGAGDLSEPKRAGVESRIRVLLVDDHAILRQGLAGLLSRDAVIEVVGEAGDGEVAVQMARSLRPEVVLMDVSMPRMNGIEATRLIHAEFPDMIVIGLSLYAEPHRADEMRLAGASAYVSKSEAADVLVATLHAWCGR
jgi:PAS domain S-box-containing protein